VSRETFSGDASRAQYASRFNKVLDYIQANLAAPLGLETLAAVACFSPYHFHRLFHAWTGETTHDFILRLRLERAARHLVYDRQRSITEIALDCGFASASSFARAFKSFHGIPASEWRATRKIREAGRKISKDTDSAGRRYSAGGYRFGFFREETFAVELNVKVKHIPPMHVAYVRHMGPFQENAALFEHLFGRLAAWASPSGVVAEMHLTPSRKSEGLDLLRRTKELRPQAHFVVITGPDSPEGEQAALEAGADAVISEPFELRPSLDRLDGPLVPGSDLRGNLP